MEKTLHDTGHYKYWEIPRLHMSEQRRLFEGVNQDAKMKNEAVNRHGDSDSPEMNEQKQRIQDGQDAERQSMLDDINQSQPAT